MSLTGSFVLARSSDPLDDLASLASIEDWPEYIDTYGDDWQVGFWPGTTLVEAAGAVLSAVTAETDAGALLAFVEASDYVHIEARCKDHSWRACLYRAEARAHMEAAGEDIDRIYDSPVRACEHASRWARCTDLVPSREALEALFSLERRDRPAEGLLINLLTSLGVRKATTR